MKKTLRILLIFSLILALVVSGCGSASSSKKESSSKDEKKTHISIGKDDEEQAEGDTEAASEESESEEESVLEIGNVITLSRPSFLGELVSNVDAGFVPSASSYQVTDISQIENADRYKYTLENSGIKDKLLENLFVSTEGYSKEFFEIYESNRYNQLPNFVTVDSLMHTYHLYFAYLLKRTEKTASVPPP